MTKNFVSELRRRNVLPTVIPYVGLIWLLLQVVSVLQPMLNFNPLVSTFTAITLFAGFPVVLYLSWYFNFTLHGLEPIEDNETGEFDGFGATKWAVLILITCCSGAMGYMYFGEIKNELVKREEGVSQTITATSIAVLPFRDQSPDKDQLYIAEGLTEELTALLGKVSELKVAAASSSFALSDKNLTPVDIAKRLNVDVIVTGSVRVTGNRLKIRTELIDSSNGMTLWTDTFSRKFKDIFAVEEEISRSIVNLLEDRYLEKGQVTSLSKTASTDAYVMFLKGREQYRLQTTKSIKEARKYFEQAIALDPEYVNAFVALADTILLLEKGQSRLGVLETDIAIQLVDQQLSKALVRDQNHARSYAIQGKLFELKQDFDAAISSFDKAISINPSLAIAHMWRFTVTRQVGRHNEAFESIQTALALDPISITNLYNMGLAYSTRGKFTEAEIIFNKMLDEFPDSPLGNAGLANNYFMQGQLAKTAEYWSFASKMSPENENYRYTFLDTLLTLKMTVKLRELTDDDTYEASLLLIEGEFLKLFKLMDFQIKSNPDDPWVKFEGAWYQALQGDKKIAIELLLQSQQGLSDEDMFSMPMCSPAIEFAWAFNQVGDVTKAKKYLQKCQALSDASKHGLIIDSFADHLSFRIAVLDGNLKQATAHLKMAIDNGWREWWTEKDPILSEVEKTPELQALFDFIDSELASEKAKAELLFSTPEANQPD